MTKHKKKKDEINVKALNIYNNKRYIATNKDDNIIKAKDNEGNTYIMAKADLKVIK